MWYYKYTYIYMYSNYDQLPSLFCLCPISRATLHVRILKGDRSGGWTWRATGRHLPGLVAIRATAVTPGESHPKTEDNCSCGPVAGMFCLIPSSNYHNGVIILP